MNAKDEEERILDDVMKRFFGSPKAVKKRPTPEAKADKLVEEMGEPNYGATYFSREAVKALRAAFRTAKRKKQPIESFADLVKAMKPGGGP